MKRSRSYEKSVALFADRAPGIVVFCKIPEPVQITSRKGRAVSGRLEPRRSVDFCGVLKGGRALYVEAKYTRGDKPSWSPDKRLLEGHQGQILAAVHGTGGVAIVTLFRGSTGREYVIPWTQPRGPISKDRKSIRWSDLVKYQLGTGETWIHRIPHEKGE